MKDKASTSESVPIVRVGIQILDSGFETRIRVKVKVKIQIPVRNRGQDERDRIQLPVGVRVWVQVQVGSRHRLRPGLGSEPGLIKAKQSKASIGDVVPVHGQVSRDTTGCSCFSVRTQHFMQWVLDVRS